MDTDALIDAEFSAAAAAVNEMRVARQAAAETEWVRRYGHEHRSWQLAAFSEFLVRWLTVEEPADLQQGVDQLVRRYGERRDPSTRPPGARPTTRMYVSGFPVGSPRDQGV